VARSLRTQRSFTVGVMVPEVSEGYGTLLLVVSKTICFRRDTFTL
jgi:DNA-binding LacI/PurR family transcriptional regulator